MSLHLHPTIPNALLCRRCDAVEHVGGLFHAATLLAIIGGLEAKHRLCEPVERITLTPAGTEALSCTCADCVCGRPAGTCNHCLNPLCPRHGDARDTSIAPVTNGRLGGTAG